MVSSYFLLSCQHLKHPILASLENLRVLTKLSRRFCAVVISRSRVAAMTHQEMPPQRVSLIPPITTKLTLPLAMVSKYKTVGENLHQREKLAQKAEIIGNQLALGKWV